MNHEKDSIVLDQEDHLKVPAISGLSPDKQLLIVDPPRVRSTCIADDKFGIFREHSMKVALFHIPPDPPKLLHKLSIYRIWIEARVRMHLPSPTRKDQGEV